MCGFNPNKPIPSSITIKEADKEVTIDHYISKNCTQQDFLNWHFDSEVVQSVRNEYYKNGIELIVPLFTDLKIKKAFCAEKSFAKYLNDNKNQIDSALNELEKNLRKEYPFLGKDFDVINYIRIDGLSPDAKWGPEYDRIEFRADQKRVLYLERIKEAFANGAEIALSRISVKRLENGQNEIEPYGDNIPLVYSHKTMERTKVFVGVANDFLREFTTHPLANFDIPENRMTGVNWTGMDKAYRKLRAMSPAVHDVPGNYGKILEAYTSFRTYLIQYQEEEENRFQTQINTTRRRSEKRRLETRKKNFRNRIDSLLSKLDSKYSLMNNYAIGLQLIENPTENPDKYNFDKLSTQFADTAALKGWPANYFSFTEKATLPNELNWIQNLDYNTPLTDEQINQVKDKAGFDFPDSNVYLNIGTEILKNTIGEGDKQKNVREVLNELGYMARETTIRSLFLMWTISEKNLTLQEASALYKAHIAVQNGEELIYIYPENREQVLQYEKEFLDFMLKNPFNYEIGVEKGHITFTEEELNKIIPPFDEETEEEKQTRLDTAKKDLVIREQKRSLKNWARIFHNTKNVLDGYQLPNIDYSDYEQVRDYFDEFNLLRNLGVDGVQEMRRITNQTKNDKKDFSLEFLMAEEMGGEKEYFNTLHTFDIVQNVFETMFSYPYESPGDKFRYMGGILAERAFYRSLAGDIMGTIRGKDIKEVVKTGDLMLIPYNTLYLGDVKTKFLGADPAFHYSYPDAAASLFYHNNHHYNQQNRIFAKQIEKPYLKNIAKDIAHYAINARSNPIPEGIAHYLKEIKTAEDVLDFLYSPVKGQMTGKEWIFVQYNNMRGRLYRDIFQQKGIKDSELFLVDNQSPETLWGKKYKDVSAEEKELCYRVELLKVIAEGTRNVQMRSFEISKDYKLIEKDPVLIYAPVTVMQNQIDNFRKFMSEKGNILSYLKNFRENLKNTQDNRNANFTGNERTGSLNYQQMCRALEDAIEALSNNGIKPDQIREKIETLEQAGIALREESEGYFFSPQGPIRERFDRTNEMLNEDILERFRNLMNGLDSPLIYSEPNLTALDININVLKVQMEYLNTGLGNKTIDYQQDLKDLVREKIFDKIDALPRDDRFVFRNRLGDKGLRAIEYLIKFFKSKLTKPLTGEEPKITDYSLIRKAEGFWDTVDELTENPIFQDYMVRDPEGCVKNWETVENQAKAMIQESSDTYNNTIQQGGRTAFQFVAYLQPNDHAHPNAVNYILSNPDNFPIDAFKARLAEVIMLQILKSDNTDARHIRQGLAAGILTKDQLRQEIVRYISEKNLLVGRRNITNTQTKLNSLQFASEVAKAARESMLRAREIERRDREERINQINGLLTFIDVNHDGHISPDEWNNFVTGTKLTITNDADKDLEEAGNRLNSRIRVKVQNPETKESEDMDVTLNCTSFKDTIGFHADRISSLQRNFIFWTMGSKDMEFEDAYRICNTVPKYNQNNEITNQAEVERADQLRYEFSRFCTEHPIRAEKYSNEDNEDQIAQRHEEFENNCREWAEIVLKATDNMKKFKIPDVNYRDMKEVGPVINMVYSVSAMGLDISQELGAMFNTNTVINGKRVASEKFGMKKYEDMRSFWTNLSAVFSPIAYGYSKVPSHVDKPAVELKRTLIKTALMREMSMYDLQNYRGLNLEQVAEKTVNNNTALYHANLATDLYAYCNTNDVVSVDVNSAIEYLQGKTDGTFDKDAKEFLRNEEQKYINRFKNSYLGSIAVIRSRILNESLYFRDALLEVDSKDETKIKEFLKTPIPGKLGFTYGDEFEEIFKNFEDANIYPILKKKGLSVTDLFLVNGTALSERQDIVLNNSKLKNDYAKEQRLRFELLRYMLQNEYSISVRNFSLENDKLVEKEPVLIVPARANARSYVKLLTQCREVIKDINSELVKFKVKIQGTMDTPDANFDPRVKEEGNTQEFKNLCKCLQRAIKATTVNDGRVNKKAEIEESLFALAHAARRYYETHTGFFGGEPIQPYGKTRYHASASIRDDSIEYLARFTRYISQLPTNSLVSGDDDFRNGDITSSIDSIKNNARFKEIVEDEFDSDMFCRHEYLASEIRLHMTEFKRKDYVADNPRLGNHMNTARDYLARLWEDKIVNRSLSFNDLDTMLHPKERLTELALNPVFLRMFNLDKKDCVRRFGEIELRAGQSVEQQRNELEKIKEQYGSLTNFVMGFEKPQNGGYTLEVYKSTVNDALLKAEHSTEKNSQDDKYRMYLKLAEVAMRMIMLGNDYTAKKMRFEDAANPYQSAEKPGFFDNFSKKLAAAMIGDNTLSLDKLQTTLQKLENGELAKYAEKLIEQSHIFDIYRDELLAEISANRSKEEKNIANPVIVNPQEKIINANPAVKKPQKQIINANPVIEKPQEKMIIDNSVMDEAQMQKLLKNKGFSVNASSGDGSIGLIDVLPPKKDNNKDLIEKNIEGDGKNLFKAEERNYMEDGYYQIIYADDFNVENPDGIENEKFNLEGPDFDENNDIDFKNEDLNLFGVDDIKEMDAEQEDLNEMNKELDLILNKDKQKEGNPIINENEALFESVKAEKDFLEKNEKKPDDMSEDDFFYQRFRAFVRVLCADKLVKQNLNVTKEEVDKQEVSMINDTSFTKVLQMMVKEKSNKQLCDIIKNDKFGEEYSKTEEKVLFNNASPVSKNGFKMNNKANPGSKQGPKQGPKPEQGPEPPVLGGPK